MKWLPMIGRLPRPQALALQAIGRFRGLMHRQVTTLFYAKGSRTYGTKACTGLTQRGLTQMILLPKATAAGGSPGVWFLTPAGVKALRLEEIEVLVEPKPVEGSLFMEHMIAANDAVIAFLTLERTNPAIRVQSFWSEAEIRRWHLPSAPDGWVHLTVGEAPLFAWIELDQATEHINKWKDKVRKITVFYASGGYKEHFGTDRLTIAVFAPSDERRDTLLRWTVEELGGSPWKDHFLFTSMSPTTPPQELFYQADWVRTNGEILPFFRGGGG